MTTTNSAQTRSITVGGGAAASMGFFVAYGLGGCVRYAAAALSGPDAAASNETIFAIVALGVALFALWSGARLRCLPAVLARACGWALTVAFIWGLGVLWEPTLLDLGGFGAGAVGFASLGASIAIGVVVGWRLERRLTTDR